jgi:thioester reductase-like protein
MATAKLPQVFLTGAAGYIGAHILDLLFKARLQVFILASKHFTDT